MSDLPETLDLGWISRTLLSVQVEQRALRAMVEPLPPRFAGLEARFSAIEARLSGLEASIAGFGGLLQRQQETLDRLLAAISGSKA